MFKLKCNEEGRCPVCGGGNLEYGTMYPDDIGVIYPWTCQDCKAKGDECYNIEFAGHYGIDTEEEHINCAQDQELEE